MRHLRSTLVLASLAVLAACRDDGVVTRSPTTDAGPALHAGIVDPEKGPVRTGYVLGEDGRTPLRIGYQVVNGHAIHDGDIGLGPADRIAATPEALRQESLGVPRPSLSLHYSGASLWSDTRGVIPVREVFSPTNLWSALTQIERQVPGIDFVPYNGQSHHIVVYYGNGSNYYNGCYNGACQVYIGSSGASKQLIMHEFGHALGYQHEQKRCDRNSYIRMIDVNPYPDQFSVACDWVQMGGYDLTSIMHYNSREFGRLHFTDLNGAEVCGYWCRTDLSAGDVAAWRKLYPASAIIVDSNNANNNTSQGYIEVSANWISTSATAGYYGTGYYYASTQAVSDPAVFWFYLPSAGTRTVDAWWTTGTNRSTTAPFVAYNASGTEVGRVSVNQQVNGGKWNALGTWSFSAGWNRVVLSRWTTSGYVVIADAVRVR
ncbi:MAG TPA: M12 family metallopeptidase [Longimicrobiaceae bacterium]|nr:M12 family metallopeptidase [Longimicrobiaceae bacterium]